MLNICGSGSRPNRRVSLRSSAKYVVELALYRARSDDADGPLLASAEFFTVAAYMALVPIFLGRAGLGVLAVALDVLGVAPTNTDDAAPVTPSSEGPPVATPRL